MARFCSSPRTRRWSPSRLRPTSASSERSWRWYGACNLLGRLLAALLLLGLAACTPGALSRPAPGPPDPRQEVQEFLAQQAQLFLDGEVDSYLASLSPEARATEQPIVDGARGVPLAHAELTLAPSARPADDSTFTGAGVDLVYRYRGLPDDNRFRIQFRYDLRKVDGDWQVAASVLAPESKPPIWAGGPVETARSEHFLAIFRPGLPDPASVLELAEQAREGLEEKITFPLEETYLLLPAADRAQYEEFSARQVPPTAIAQAEMLYEITPRAVGVEGRQILVNLAELRTRAASIETLQHELGHLALAPDTRPFTPAWVGESAAMYLAGTRPTRVWRNGVRQRRFDEISFAQLNTETSLGAHDPSGLAASYEYAYAAAAAYYLIEEIGADSYWKFYRFYAEVPAGQVYEALEAADTGPALADLAVSTTREALGAVFGFDESELDERVRGWIRDDTR